MTLPKISVITPCFNHARFIEATMRSIHDQGYPELEHIVIDGGSTDGSVDIIASYSDRLAYWVSESDGGQTDALRKGFEKATGEIQCWLNSDDLYEPETLWQVAEYFGANPGVAFVYGDSRWVDVDGVPIKPKREHDWSWYVMLHDHNFIAQASAFWRGSLYKEVGGLDLDFDLAMDADLWVRFAERTTPRHVRAVWSSMRFYPEQKNTRMREASMVEMDRIRDRYVGAGGSIERAIRKALARSIRIGKKARTGGYPPTEVAQHLSGLLGRGTWEERQARKSTPLDGH